MYQKIQFLILICFIPFLCAQQRVNIAVLYFENNSLMDKESLDGLRKGLCDMMITELSKISGFNVVEREKLEKIMTEIALGQSGMVTASAAPQVGKLLGAQALLLGGFIKDLGGNIRIDTRIVMVESGEILKAEEVTGGTRGLFRLVKKLCFKIADELDVQITKEEKRRINNSDQVSIEALLVYSNGLNLLDKGDRHGALIQFEKALSLDSGFEKAGLEIKKIKEAP